MQIIVSVIMLGLCSMLFISTVTSTPATAPVAPVVNNTYTITFVDAPAVATLQPTTTTTLGERIFSREYSSYEDVSYNELLAVSVALYCEARGEEWFGIAAVADTIRNRVNSDLFADTFYEVVTSPSQFSCIQNRGDLYANIDISTSSDALLFAEIIGLAHRAVNGTLGRMTYNALFYHTTEVSPYWASHYENIGTVGAHVFYTTSRL